MTSIIALNYLWLLIALSVRGETWIRPTRVKIGARNLEGKNLLRCENSGHGKNLFFKQARNSLLHVKKISQTDISYGYLVTDCTHGPLWKLSSRNRVTPVSIQYRVQHGITFALILMNPAKLSPIPEAIGCRAVANSAIDILPALMPIVAWLTQHRKT